MRQTLNSAMKQAMRDKEVLRLSTLRLILAAIKDRDIAERATGNDDGVNDDEILSILAKMIKQRKDSAEVYQSADRKELADKELAEIQIIQEFLPKQLSEDEVKAAVQGAITETGASSIRDMGKVMGALKSKFAGQMDFGKAGGIVKSLLG